MKMLIFILVTTFSTTVLATDMTSRLGVGYSNFMSVGDMPSLAVKYYPSEQLALSAALGIDTSTENSNSSGNSNFGFNVGVYKTIFPEENMNFFMGANAGLVSSKPISSGDSSSGFELAGFIGAEFFVPGIESLGFNIMAGIGVTSTSAGVRFKTIGYSPLHAGMYFYF